MNQAHLSNSSPFSESAKWVAALLLGVLVAGGNGFADQARPRLTRQRISLPTTLIAFNSENALKPTNDAVTRTTPAKSLRLAGLSSTPRATPRVLPLSSARLAARFTRVDAPISSLPPASLQPRVLPSVVRPNATSKAATSALPEALPEMGSGSKIVQVSGLKLPPTSAPLPQWMRDKVVPLDAEFVSVPMPAQPKTRIAQNPGAAPIRQPQSPITSSDRLPNQIEVAASTYLVLVTQVDLQTVAIADPNIADVTVVNARALLVNGKTAGVTTLVVVDRLGKIRQYQVRVVSAPGEKPNDIAAVIGIEGVTVRQVKDTLIVEGEVETAEGMKRALDMASIFSPKVINQMTVRGKVDPQAVTALQIQEAIARPEISVRVAGKTAILDGIVASEMERQQAEQVARLYTDGVLNLLRLPTMSVEDLRKMMGATDAAPAMAMGEFGMLQPASQLVVRQVGDQIILEGTMPTQTDIDAAAASAVRTGLQVINRLQVAPAPPEEAALLNRVAAAIGLPGVRVRGTAKRLVLDGIVADSNVAVRAGQIALGFASDVDNMLVTPNPLQVNVDVSIVEISKSGLKTLGISLPSLVAGQSIGNLGIGEANGNSNIGTNFTTLLSGQINNGNVRLLSNPRATVLSGRTASFQAGGQFPIPTNVQVTNNLTTVQIEFKDFGVLMDVTPIVTPDGVVTMRVRTDITQLDDTIGSIQVAPGISIPAFTRRAAVTEVTTRSGGTIALSGLITETMRKTVTEVPFLSKIPILGKLFSSKRYQRGESDLVIFVTPRLLPNTLTDGQVAPTTPIAVGPSTVAATTLGNPGIQTFSTIGGAGVQPGAGAAAGGK